MFVLIRKKRNNLSFPREKCNKLLIPRTGKVMKDYIVERVLKAVLDVNLNERHIRGGTATKEKYKSENAQ